jgi:hypothetical protein
VIAVALDHPSQSRRASYDERGHDLYETPDVATEALLRAYPKLPGKLWEPAAGRNAIVRVLRESGREVLATDLINYGIEPSNCYGRDFLKETRWPTGCGGIVTNPPFREDLPQKFIDHALRLGAPLVVMLLRTNFLESAKRTPILEGAGLQWILQFRKRLPMMHRDGWQGQKANSGMGFGGSSGVRTTAVGHRCTAFHGSWISLVTQCPNPRSIAPTPSGRLGGESYIGTGRCCCGYLLVLHEWRG